MFVDATQIYALQSSLLHLGPTYWKKISEFMNMIKEMNMNFV